MTGRCERCPVAGGPCRAQVDPAYRVFCGLAAGGEPSQVAAIRAASAGPPAPRPASYPSPLRMAANLATAAVQFVASGGELVDREEYDRRRAICRACPSGLYVLQDDACLACGCNMRAKSRGAAWKCDRGHW